MDKVMKLEEIVRALRCRLTSDELEACEKANVGEHGCAECLISYTHEAAALIEQLTAENTALHKELEWKDMVIALAQRKQAEAENERDALREKVPQWISVRDRLPKPGARVIATDGVSAGEACMGLSGELQRLDLPLRWLTLTGQGATHWMPLPAAPEEKKHESE